MKINIHRAFLLEVAKIYASHTGTEPYPVNAYYQKCRNRDIVKVRQLAIWIIDNNKSILHYTLQHIANPFNQDHATVINAIKTVNNLIETEKQFAVLAEKANNYYVTEILPILLSENCPDEVDIIPILQSLKKVTIDMYRKYLDDEKIEMLSEYLDWLNVEE